jgi:hypothetical protein
MKKLIAILWLLPLFAWAQSPFDGTWRVDVSTAKLAQKPETFALQNGEYTCSTCVPKIAVKADGSDQRVPGAKDFDTIAVKQVDFKSVQYTRKKDGKVIHESTDSVSPDGRTQTMVFKDYPTQGKPVTGKILWTRVSPAPGSAHAISGSWRIQKVENVSDNGLTFTFKGTAAGLSMTSPTGESYDAKFDGKDYPLKRDRAGGTISLKKIDGATMEATYKQDGKPVIINRITVKGRVLTITQTDPRRGTTEVFMAQKQ